MSSDSEIESRLSQIATRWSLIAGAHDAANDDAGSARAELLERYSGAAFRYLLALTRDVDAAEELLQEFAIKFLRGDFRNAAPDRGRFRVYLKAALRRMVTDRCRADVRGARQDLDVDIADPGDARHEELFEQGWRDDLLHRAWRALSKREERTGTPFFTILRYRSEHPKESSSDAAAALSERLGRPMTDANVRQITKRAREAFAEAIIDEVAASLGTGDTWKIEEELSSIGLLPYCRDAIRKRAT